MIKMEIQEVFLKKEASTKVPSKDEVTTRPKSLAKTRPSSTRISIGQVLSKLKGHLHSAKSKQAELNHQNLSLGQVKSSRVQPPKIINRPSP
ncbi:unnamed protein product [Cochlearia groenlandica]